jgi:hypothetical protein
VAPEVVGSSALGGGAISAVAGLLGEAPELEGVDGLFVTGVVSGASRVGAGAGAAAATTSTTSFMPLLQ